MTNEADETPNTELKTAAHHLRAGVADQFHLVTDHAQVSFAVTDRGHLLTTYAGPLVGERDLSYVVTDVARASYMGDTDGVVDYKIEQLPASLPTFGNSDLNEPAIQLEFADGSRLTDLRYVSHSFATGKPELPGLPSARDDGDTTTLEIVLADAVAGVRCLLSVTAYRSHDVFAQHVSILNDGSEPLTIARAMSLHLPLPRSDMDVITLTGAWGREAHVIREPLRQGVQGVRSARGATGHGQSPFLALTDPRTTEEAGPAIGVTLVYSGNFSATCEVDMHEHTRVDVGINPFDFSWRLEPGERFETPEALLTLSEHGLGELSHRFHTFLTDALVPRRWAYTPHPVVLNSWEAAYFDFDRERLLALADRAAEAGVELFVVDDGWYGDRQDTTTSLGDWYPNEEKLGGTLDSLIDAVHARGLGFGIWVEPEMVCEDSDLFRAHPEWRMEVPGRTPQRIRSEYPLDLTRVEVQDHLIEAIAGLLEAHDIAYLKWDMNRNLTDLYSPTLAAERQKEVAHRYMLGLYRVIGEVARRNPEVLIETCAGGGGRFDAGMLAYSSQIWASDDTDAIARLGTQEGLSHVFPSATMSCHVSAAPNHQVGRTTPLATRTAVAQQGAFGYELDLTALSDDEITGIRADIDVYKERRDVLQFGVHRRLTPPDAGNAMAWQKALDDRVIVTLVRILARPNTVPKRLQLRGLDAAARYRVGDRALTGAELMHIGLPIEPAGEDFSSSVWDLTRLDEGA